MNILSEADIDIVRRYARGMVNLRKRAKEIEERVEETEKRAERYIKMAEEYRMVADGYRKIAAIYREITVEPMFQKEQLGKVTAEYEKIEKKYGKITEEDSKIVKETDGYAKEIFRKIVFEYIKQGMSKTEAKKQFMIETRLTEKKIDDLLEMFWEE